MAANWSSILGQGSDVASAATVTLGDGVYFNVIGTTGISDIDFTTDWNGRPVVLKFAGILILTHSATLILPTGANITTAAGDVAIFVSEGSDAVRCVAYMRANGQALSGSGITNSAGSNVIPKSNGTNLIASLLTDDGTDVTVSPPAAGSLIIQQAGSPSDDSLKVFNAAAAVVARITKEGYFKGYDGLDTRLVNTSIATLSFIINAGSTRFDFYDGSNYLMRIDSDSTADNIRLLVWDVTGASLKRVSRGAADSGGTGFRLLRIAN